jgi:hypothetical protein
MSHRRALIRAALSVLVLAALLVLSAQAASVATGKFTAVAMDTPTPRTIRTGLTHVRSLKIYVRVPTSSVAETASTTDQIQGDLPGSFIYQGRWLRGLTINPDGSFTASNDMFKRPGVTFYWEAFGD